MNQSIHNIILEHTINFLITRNNKILRNIKRLNNTIIRIELLEQNISFTLYIKENQIHISNSQQYLANCTIRICLRLFFLSIINFSNQNMKNFSIKILGNTQLAKYLYFLLYSIIQTYIDILSIKNIKLYYLQSINNQIKNLKILILEKIENFQQCLNLAITDEWKLIPHFLELLWLYQEIYDLRKKIILLSNRIKNMSKSNDFS